MGLDANKFYPVVKSVPVPHQPPHVHRLRVVGKLESHRDGCSFFQLAGQNQAQAVGAEVGGFAAEFNVLGLFENGHPNRDRDRMTLGSALKCFFRFFDHLAHAIKVLTYHCWHPAFGRQLRERKFLISQVTLVTPGVTRKLAGARKRTRSISAIPCCELSE